MPLRAGEGPRLRNEREDLKVLKLPISSRGRVAAADMDGLVRWAEVRIAGPRVPFACAAVSSGNVEERCSCSVFSLVGFSSCD